LLMTCPINYLPIFKNRWLILKQVKSFYIYQQLSKTKCHAS